MATKKAAKKVVKKVVKKAASPVKKTVETKVAKKAVKKAATKRKPNAQFMKPVQPDTVLAAVVGDKGIPRTEITKKLWAYIKKNGLQDKVNKRNINADDKLLAIFGGKKTVSMFEMTKLVSNHIK